MASAPATATSDTLITLKVNFDGVARRFKLPLRDLGSNTFEGKVRSFLQIPDDTNAVIERYSDSATTYVTLNPTNVSVYKQLYRAAKAKQKLKLRVTTIPTEPKETIAPRPVTVEDAPEEDAQTVQETKTDDNINCQNLNDQKQEKNTQGAASTVKEESGVIDTVIAPKTSRDFPSFVKEWQARGNPRIHLRRDGKGTEVIDFLKPSAPTEPWLTREAEAESHASGFPESLATVNLAGLMRELCNREDAAKNEGETKQSLTTPRYIPRSHALKELMARSAARLNKIEPATELPKFSTPVIKSTSPTLEEEKKEEMMVSTHTTGQRECVKRPFTVCCNSCDQSVPEAHFHCSICDEGDFDLCQECVDRGITCNGDGHWLIKRTVVNGDIRCSSTHIAPKSVRFAVREPSVSSFPTLSNPIFVPSRLRDLAAVYTARTCNCCVQEFPEQEFVHCTTCDDYDLCKTCFAKNQHGHHPKHGFVPAVKGTVFDQQVTSRLEPGRDILHNAICDGCDKYVRGIRHKCLDCPDWDYCSDCVKDADFIHANHRFVAIYEPLADRPFRSSSRTTHYGISCDGPLCASGAGRPRYIVGERYKCAVCHDTDFCANCEASPANTHNRTHPLIKFKTPVRHVSVTTTGEHEDGQRLPTMGDRSLRARTSIQSSPKLASMENIAATPVQTVVDVQPTEQASPTSSDPAETVEVKEELEVEHREIKDEDIDEKPSPFAVKPLQVASTTTDLVAAFKWDTIQDGSILPPNHTFEQTWVLRNEGTIPWPAGCAVKFVGGDYMGAVDPAHPAGIHELVSASESTICYNALNPGQEFPFTVLMRTPDREGKVISYWRLTTPDGIKFGHKLWCDVTVQTPAKTEHTKAEVPPTVESEPTPESETEVEQTISDSGLEKSRMIIPKLDHESPSASMHGALPENETQTTLTEAPAPFAFDSDAWDCGEDDWAEESDSGFLTDEEYDILDASDEEFLFQQRKN